MAQVVALEDVVRMHFQAAPAHQHEDHFLGRLAGAVLRAAAVDGRGFWVVVVKKGRERVFKI
jgi:hypothetical protein